MTADQHPHGCRCAGLDRVCPKRYRRTEVEYRRAQVDVRRREAEEAHRRPLVSP